MKRRRIVKVAAVVMALAPLGGALLLQHHNQSRFEVRYGSCLADRKDVSAVREIVLHERWAALWSAIRRRDVRNIRNSARQLAFGRLRLIAGADVGEPVVEVFYEDGLSSRYWAQYTLHYQNGRWTSFGYFYGDAHYYGKPDFGTPKFSR